MFQIHNTIGILFEPEPWKEFPQKSWQGYAKVYTETRPRQDV
jgi:hypothetical protein